MSLREITPDDVESLAVGAWVLGTGGGGNPYLSLLNMRALHKEGKRVHLMPASDLDDDAYVAVIAGMGAPLADVSRAQMARAARSLAMETKLSVSAARPRTMRSKAASAESPARISARA